MTAVADGRGQCQLTTHDGGSLRAACAVLGSGVVRVIAAERCGVGLCRRLLKHNPLRPAALVACIARLAASEGTQRKQLKTNTVRLNTVRMLLCGTKSKSCDCSDLRVVPWWCHGGAMVPHGGFAP